MRRLVLGLLFAAPILLIAPLRAQSPCSGTQAWASCDWPFDLTASENPDTFELHAEFQSPVKHKTYLLHAFRDGDRHFVIRFTPTEEGSWEYRLSSNLSRFQGQAGKIDAVSGSSPGFVSPANVHHFKTADGKPHLWMAAAIDNFLSIPQSEFASKIADIAAAKFTHLRVTIPANADLHAAVDRIRDINSHGLVADVVLAAIPADAAARRTYVQDMASRLSALNITWMGLPGFEDTLNGRAILKDTGAILKQYDPYDHPRTTIANVTSGTVGNDPWTNVLAYGTPDPNIGAVEHQLFGDPAINTGIQSVGDLWTATMNGQYPASGSGAYMTAWFDFMSANRYWELEPYFDVSGGRAIALEGVEYVVYVEKPGPIELTVVDHGYDVEWVDPATGARTKAKGYKGQHFTGEPPDKSHPWVLHVSRESEKQRMLNSYYFDSREIPIQLQQIELNPDKTPYQVAAPPEGDLSVSHPPKFELQITKPSRSTRTLLVEWTGEVTSTGQGYRVIGSGSEGTFQIPTTLGDNTGQSMLVHVYVMNAYGKVYELDRVYRLTQ